MEQEDEEEELTLLTGSFFIVGFVKEIVILSETWHLNHKSY